MTPEQFVWWLKGYMEYPQDLLSLYRTSHVDKLINQDDLIDIIETKLNEVN